MGNKQGGKVQASENASLSSLDVENLSLGEVGSLKATFADHSKKKGKIAVLTCETLGKLVDQNEYTIGSERGRKKISLDNIIGIMPFLRLKRTLKRKKLGDIAQIFKALDDDGNGFVDLGEFIHMCDLAKSRDLSTRLQIFYKVANSGKTDSLDASGAQLLSFIAGGKDITGMSIDDFVKEFKDTTDPELLQELGLTPPNYICIETLTFSTSFYPYVADDALDVLLVKINDSEGIPTTQLSLYGKDVKLVNEKTMKENNVSAGDTLLQILSLR